LFKFLGLTPDNPHFTVYLSSLFVQPGGAVDFRGTPRCFAGPAVSAAELSVIEPVRRLFSNAVLDGLPASLRSWLARNAHWSFGAITPDIWASPQDRHKVEAGNLLTVGSQYYNSAGDLYTETCGTLGDVPVAVEI
jgi:hypothetical protein